METISLGGRRVAGFALGQPVGASGAGVVSPQYAAVMTGATVGLLAYALRAPLWVDILGGVAAAVVTKASIDKAASA